MMKMSPKLFAALKADFAVMRSFVPFDPSRNELSNAFTVFNAIMFQRQNDDIHPAFTSGRVKRILSPHIKQDGFSWLDQFYVQEDLNDDHIRTAIKKILESTR